MVFAMGNCIVMEDTNGNRKLLKKRREAKIDAVAANNTKAWAKINKAWNTLLDEYVDATMGGML